MNDYSYHYSYQNFQSNNNDNYDDDNDNKIYIYFLLNLKGRNHWVFFAQLDGGKKKKKDNWKSDDLIQSN